MGTVVEIRGKTEQRVQHVIAALKKRRDPVDYDTLIRVTGANYDSLLYILATLIEVGMVNRTNVADGPGRPKVHFVWVRGELPATGTGRVSGTR